jgi:hypothetical protein
MTDKPSFFDQIHAIEIQNAIKEVRELEVRLKYLSTHEFDELLRKRLERLHLDSQSAVASLEKLFPVVKREPVQFDDDLLTTAPPFRDPL